MPAVSVVIAAHNGERYLGEAIDSVRRQTLAEIEIIIVDDASSDETREVVLRAAVDDSRIRYISADVRSAGAARNIGWQAGRAAYVAILDQDDLMEPERLEQQLLYLESHAEIGLVGAYCHLVDGAGRRCGNLGTVADPDVVTERLWSDCSSSVVHTTAMFRRSVLEELGGYREIPGTSVEDLDLFLRVAEHCRVANVPEYLGSWRIHSSNSSQTVVTMIRWALAVQAAARLRRAGRPDPLVGRPTWDPPTEAELAGYGFTRDDLRHGVFEFHLIWVDLLLAVHDHAGSTVHLGHARRALDTAARSERTSYLIARSRMELALRKPLRSALSALGALALEPRSAGRSLVHPVIGGAGRAVYRRLPAAGGGAPGRWLRNQVVSRLNRIR